MSSICLQETPDSFCGVDACSGLIWLLFCQGSERLGSAAKQHVLPCSLNAQMLCS